MENVLNFIVEHWASVSALVLWVAARLIKTEKNYDFLERVIKFLGENVIPNRIKSNDPVDNGEYKPGKNNAPKKSGLNLVILCVTFGALLSVLSPASSLAQLNGNFKTLRLVNVITPTDTANVLPINATIYYNEVTNKLMAYENGQWKELIQSGGGGGGNTFGNGLTLSGNNVTLGDANTTSDVNFTYSGAANTSNFLWNYSDGTTTTQTSIGNNITGVGLDVYSFQGSEESQFTVGETGITLSTFDTDSYGISMNAQTGFIITANSGSNDGMKYASPYLFSSDRAITDKGFNDDNYWRTGANFSLDAVVQVNTNGFSLRQGTNEVHTFVNSNMTQMKTSQLGNTSIRHLIEMNRNSGDGIKIADNLDNKGMFYEGDYSANWTARSIVDKAYVDAQGLTAGERIDITSGIITAKPYNIVGTASSNYSITDIVANNGRVVYATATGAGTVDVNLPDTPPNGFTVVVVDQSGNAASNNLTVQVSGGGTINGAATYVINTNYGSAVFNHYTGNDWFVLSANN